MGRCQQYELYAAEGGVDLGRAFLSQEECQRWVDDLRENLWWDRFYPQVLHVEVVFTKSKSGSVGGYWHDHHSGKIEMGPTHQNELVVIHELSHVLADARYKSQGHCPWFARVYLELVYLIMGEKHYKELHYQFDAAGIEHDPPRNLIEIGRYREI